MNYEDRIYHSGYLDGYYASRELYHSDDSEMTEEEKAKARRKRRRRNIALGLTSAALIGGSAYTYHKAKKAADAESAEWDAAMKRNRDGFGNWAKTVRTTHSAYDPTANYSGHTEMHRVPPTAKAKPKRKRTIPGFRRNVTGSYKINPTGDLKSYLTLHGFRIRESMRNWRDKRWRDRNKK